MTHLYSSLAKVYEAMYQTFINYEVEYKFYSSILLKYNKKQIAELGCGTGNLAHYFLQNGFQYTGIDLSNEMLQLAASRNPDALFLQGDMRNFTLPDPVDAFLMAGRTISYLVTDKDVYQCFHSVNNHLNDGGIFCFDFIDASRFIPSIAEGKEIIHHANVEMKQYKRSSFWKLNDTECFTFSWASLYYELYENGKEQFLGKDDSVIRAFTKDDIALFLKLSGFAVLQFIDKPSYAFDTYAVIAQKNKF